MTLWVRAMLLPMLVSASISIPTHEIAPGVRMPVLSIGNGGQERSNARNITAAWMGLGGRGVDTAWMYHNQAEVARAIKESGVDRKDVFITTKIPSCADTASYVEKDLLQLETDYIDLLLIHEPGIGDCSAAWATLEDYHAKGILTAIGVSNFKRSNIEALMKTAKVTPAVNQIELNVFNHDDDTIACATDNKITIEAYSPVGRSGTRGNISGNAVIQAVGAAHGVSTYQVAMKWILQHGHVLTFQSSSQAHQQSDADLFGFNLTDDEVSRLDSLQEQFAVIV